MLRGFVLRYLAVIAGGGDPAAARHEIPPPLRAAVERRARKHTILAGFDSARADDAGHVARLAYLRVNKTPAHTDELVAVELAFTNRRSLGKERRAGWVFAASTSFAVAVIGLALGAGFLYSNRALPDPPTESSEPEPSLGELLGMDQQTHHALRPVFRDLLPSYTVALDAHQRGREPAPPNDLEGARARVIERLRRDSPDLVAPMVALFDAAERFSARRDELERTEGGQSDAELWTRRLVALHGALREQDVPFYVDATLRFDRRTGSQRVLMSTYDVRSRRPSLAHTSLLHVASFVMDRNGWRMPEAYAAVALFEVLADEHGVEHSALVVRRRIQRAQVSRIYGAVRALSGVALSALASRAWTALYGEPLAPIELEE